MSLNVKPRRVVVTIDGYRHRPTGTGKECCCGWRAGDWDCPRWDNHIARIIHDRMYGPEQTPATP